MPACTLAAHVTWPTPHAGMQGSQHQGAGAAPPPARIAYGLPLPMELPAAERLTRGLAAYFLDDLQLQPLAGPAALPQASSRAEQGPIPDLLACCGAEVDPTPLPFACGRAGGDPSLNAMHAMSGVLLDGLSPGEPGHGIEQDAALPGEQRLDPGQRRVVIGDSSVCDSNERWTAHAALVLIAPAHPDGTQGVQVTGSALAQSAAASAAQHVSDDCSQMQRPGLTGPGLQDGMQEPRGASGDPVACAAGSVSIYLFENWAPLQRPAGALAKALCDGALWSDFGISVTVRLLALLLWTLLSVFFDHAYPPVRRSQCTMQC